MFMTGVLCTVCGAQVYFHALYDHTSPEIENRFTSIVRNAFIFKNGNRRYKYLVLGHEETYFVKEHPDSKNK